MKTSNTPSAKSRLSKSDSLKHINTLKKEIENITEEEFIEFLNFMSIFHKYSFNNNILICSQNQNASQVASFKKWKEQNRKVKKGEKAIWIFAPTKFKKEVETENDEIELIEGISFIQVPVFDISQTEGEDIERTMTISSHKPFSEISNFVKDIEPRLNIEYKPMEISCGGSYSKDTLTICLNSNLNEKEHIGTLIHELSHHLLGHGSDSDLEKSQREQEAETLTYLFCNKFNIQRKSAFYLKTWKGIAENIEKIFNVYRDAINKYELNQEMIN